MSASSQELTLSVIPNPPLYMVTSRDSVPVEVASDCSQQRHGSDSGVQATQSDHKGTIPSIAAERLSEDGYNWRKYGQKHIKGSEFPRSYYRCSHPNCQVKKQLERSPNGQITEIIYKGEHDHPKPQPSHRIAVGTILSTEEERSCRISSLNSIEDKSPNGQDLTSHHTKPNGTPECSPVTASDDNIEGAGAQSSVIGDEVEDDDDPESKRRCLKLNTETASSASAALNHQQCKPSVQVHGQCHSHSFVSSPSAKTENIPASSQELTLSATVPNSPVYMATSRAIVPVEVASDESRQTESLDMVVQSIQSNHNVTSPLIAVVRSSEDGYNWRKYGQKQIKGSEFPRSYYRCTHPNCQAKKQLVQSHDGKITEIIYKGKHDHPKPQPSLGMAVGTILSIQERSVRFSSLNSTDDKSSNGQGLASYHTKPNGTPEHCPVTASDGDVEGAGAQSNRIGDEVEDDDDPESKHRCFKFNRETTTNASSGSNHQPCESSVQVQGQCTSQTFVSSPSAKNENIAASSHELNLSVTDPNPPVYMVPISASVPVEITSNESQQKHGLDSGFHAMQSYHKGTTERSLEDGYNWRKYGQKHIKGSEFPRSYYRCTHPNCQVKKQLERSHDGKITEIIYMGKHDHPKPQPSLGIAVGTILSFQEERSDRLSFLNSTEDKSSNGHGQTSHHTKPNGTAELSLVVARGDDVEGAGAQSNRIGDKIDDDVEPESKHRRLEFNTEATSNASSGLNHQQCKPSVQVQGQCQSQSFVSSPSVKIENTATSSQELTPSVTVPNSPIHMATSRAIVPVEIASDESQQIEGLDSGVQETQSNQKGTSPSIAVVRSSEDGYNWRKYGQKNIKGSEFPRSYYRCTHPNCKVKKQLERSNAGKITEIIYMGKHDHPKPQPSFGMVVGTILSIQEERSSRYSSLNSIEDNPSNGHGQTSHHTKPNGTTELSSVTARGDDVEGACANLNRIGPEVEDDDDPESKRRKKDIGGVDVAPMGKVTREPHVVQTLSDLDVLDDGYRWCKYGQKLVKGNPNPRSYYRCAKAGCPVRKHVERASHNPKAVITTYQGKHNHDVPAARTTSSHDTAKPVIHNTALNGMSTRSEESESINLNLGVGMSLSPENRSNEKQQTLEVEPIQSQSHIADPSCSKEIQAAPVSVHSGDLNDGADQERSKEDQDRSNEKQQTLDAEPIQSRSHFADPGCSKEIQEAPVSVHNGDLNDGTDQDRSKEDQDRSNEKQQTLDAEPIQSQSHIADPGCSKETQAAPDSALNGDLNDGPDHDRSKEDQDESLSFDTAPVNHSSDPYGKNMERLITDP